MILLKPLCVEYDNWAPPSGYITNVSVADSSACCQSTINKQWDIVYHPAALPRPICLSPWCSPVCTWVHYSHVFSLRPSNQSIKSQTDVTFQCNFPFTKNYFTVSSILPFCKVTANLTSEKCGGRGFLKPSDRLTSSSDSEYWQLKYFNHLTVYNLNSIQFKDKFKFNFKKSVDRLWLW